MAKKSKTSPRTSGKSRAPAKRKAKASAAANKAARAKKPPPRPEPAEVPPAIEAAPAAPAPDTAPDTAPEPAPEPMPEAAVGPAESRGGKFAIAVFVFIVVVSLGGYVSWMAFPPGPAVPEVAGGPPPTPEAAPAPTSEAAPAPTPETTPEAAAAPAPTPETTPEAAAGTAAEAAAETGRPAIDQDALERLRAERRQLRDDLARLMTRIETVETAVDSVKKMIRATQPPGDKAGPDPSVQNLTERLDELEREGGTLRELLKRVGQLEKEGAAALAAAVPTATADGARPGGGDGTRGRALVLAVANLRQAVATDQPFAETIEALTAIAGDNPEVKVAVAVLSRSAETGIPTLATLRARFGRLAGRIVRAAKTTEKPGWWERAANRIKSLVTWRRVDDGDDGASVDAIVARAEERLRAGNLKAAVDTVQLLADKGNAARAAAPWLADAKARVAAEQAVTTLHVHAVSMLAPVRE